MDQSGEFVAEVEVLTESSGNNGNMDKESEVIRVEAVQRSQSRLNTTVVEELVTEYIRNQAGHNTGTLVTGDSLQGHLGRHVEALIIDGPPYRGQTVLVHVYRLYDEADEQELPLGNRICV